MVSSHDRELKQAFEAGLNPLLRTFSKTFNLVYSDKRPTPTRQGKPPLRQEKNRHTEECAWQGLNLNPKH